MQNKIIFIVIGILLLGVLVVVGLFVAMGGLNRFLPNMATKSSDNSVGVTTTLTQDTSDQDKSTSMDCTKLFSKSEASSILGVSSVVVSDEDSSCTYTSEDLTNIGVMVFTISALDSQSQMYYETSMQMLDAKYEVVSVNGASKAYWLPGFSQLHAINNNKLLLVSILSDASAGNEKETHITVATKILGRM